MAFKTSSDWAPSPPILLSAPRWLCPGVAFTQGLDGGLYVGGVAAGWGAVLVGIWQNTGGLQDREYWVTPSLQCL